MELSPFTDFVPFPRVIAKQGRRDVRSYFSRWPPSANNVDVLAYSDPNFTSPAKLNLPLIAAGVHGFSAIPTGPSGEGLDYLRDGLFPIDKMVEVFRKAVQ